MNYSLVIALLWGSLLFGQVEEQNPYSLDANFFYGTVLEHNTEIADLITEHPTGLIFSYNRMTYGFNDWEARYNYPDFGASFIFQDLKNNALGKNYGLYGHFNFYFLNRRLMARIGQGVALASNPFDLERNFKNTAYGSKLLSSTFLMLNYKKPNILGRIGLQAGLSLVHYSNANIKAPNTSTNTFAFNVGVNYSWVEDDLPAYIPQKRTTLIEPLRFNLVLRGGVNESDYVGVGQQPFLIVSSFVDKRINPKSTLQAGVDFFFSKFLQKEIAYKSIAFPEFGVRGDEDWKRIGLFAGHELRFNKIAFVTQVGYYMYYPYDFEGRVYFRAGLKRYLTEKIYLAVTLKSHFAKAEAVEFGLGIRL
ncbi:MAG TPA: acyloxyacyl hydrolase [Leeuwenhoekiella sp.]|nr:acyloxyacyl hydrolase [Leeuwenhoekiella sp.]